VSRYPPPQMPRQGPCEAPRIPLAFREVKLEGDLGGGRCWLSVLVTVGLALSAFAVVGCRRDEQGLAPSPVLNGADKRLLEAAQQGDPELIRAAIAEGASANCRGTNGQTPLLQTICRATAPFDSRRRQCIAFLLERGADVDAKDRDGRSALICAARAGDLEAVKVLVNAGALIKRRDGSHKTAILHAAEAGHREVVMYLGTTLKVQQHQSAW
jgi:hypothetical protein